MKLIRMKLKRTMSVLLLSALLFSTGSQAFAYNWSGYLGDNKWTNVTAAYQKKSGTSWAKWSESEKKSKGCKIGFYNTGSKRLVTSRSVTFNKKESFGDTVSGQWYRLRGRLVDESDYGILNKGTWNIN